MEKATILLVDDEPLARKRLRHLLASTSYSESQIVEAGNASEALQQTLNAQPDLAFLDIQMPGLSGLSLAEELKGRSPKTKIVFVTAHTEHAFDAYQLGAVDYLAKPVTLKRLSECLSRCPPPEHSVASEGGTFQTDYILIQSHSGTRQIPLNLIQFFRAELKYITAFTASADFIIDDSLTRLENELGAAFVRIHRSYLVRVDCITRLYRSREEDGGWLIELGASKYGPLPVSRRQLANLRHVLASRAVSIPR